MTTTIEDLPTDPSLPDMRFPLTDDMPHVTQLRIDLVECAVRVHLADSELGLAHLRTHAEATIDRTAHHAVLALAAKVASLKSVERVETERVPLTWWDHLKLTHLPRALLRRWPARMRDVTKTTWLIRTCPHLPTADMPTHFQYLQQGGRRATLGCVR